MMKSRPQRHTVRAGTALLFGLLPLVGCSEDSNDANTRPADTGMATPQAMMQAGVTDPNMAGMGGNMVDHSMHTPEQHAMHMMEGTMMEGTMMEGTMMEGTMMEGTMMEGTMMEGTMMEGTMDPPGLGQDATAGHPELEPTFTNIFENIFIKGNVGNCMATFCHGGEPSSAGNGNLQILYDDKEATYNNLVNADSTSDACSELGMKLVVPGDPVNSLLMVKLFEDPPCGARMPLGPALQDTQVNQILEWIEMGAMNN